jgi:DNA replication and repair protein RecF
MTAELDQCRQNYFFNFLRERNGQVFITTTDADLFKKEGINNARFFRVSQGKFQ